MTHTEYPTTALMRPLPALSETIKENTFDEPHSATVDSVINPATPLWAEKVKILTSSVCPARVVPPERQNARHMLPPMACGMLPAYPEHIVDEEAPEQDAASADVVQVKQLHPVEGECQTEEIVGNPVLRRTGKGDLCPAVHGTPTLHGNESVSIQPSPQLCLSYLSQQVPDPHNTAQGQAHEILGVKLVIHYFCKKTKKSDLEQARQLPFPCRAEMSDSTAGEPRAQCSHPRQGGCTHGTHVQSVWE